MMVSAPQVPQATAGLNNNPSAAAQQKAKEILKIAISQTCK